MNDKPNDLKVTDRRIRAELLPAWESMTPREQAEHLVYQHGFDEQYFEPGLPNITNDEVVTAFAGEREAPFTAADTDGNSFPHPADRTGWHDSDHKEGMPLGGAQNHPHTHREHPRTTVAETITVEGGLPLRLSFEPDAIREHFDADHDSPVAGMTDKQLRQVGFRALGDDQLYDAFHQALCAAAGEVKREGEPTAADHAAGITCDCDNVNAPHRAVALMPQSLTQGNDVTWKPVCAHYGDLDGWWDGSDWQPPADLRHGYPIRSADGSPTCDYCGKAPATIVGATSGACLACAGKQLRTLADRI